ncbi:Ppx/GppA family phosphatase [Oceanobacillus piezotolerans]|uniref:Ppx/GppA family phosphatase n=1 Tax=Oceanobacillus piezotolerans TaxID=2448030 RepID=A0A498DB51_9BACI|nr:Ppx/GppA family phosphatase [Oceanobacillus piezotolerans]RLL46798.1 Ppx/GppA family phosphatase [Oceanobacillus piezotolerans]
MQKNYYAVIDIGSNTMRLVIYSQIKTGRLHEVENVKSVARLRNYLDAGNELTEEGIHKMLSTLKSFKEVIEIYSLSQLSVVATATIRQATNKEEIKRIVQEKLGWEMRILSEKEEAYYGYLSVVNSTSIAEGITVDIGGGSTEVTYFKDRVIRHSHSFPFGALTLKSFFTEYQGEKAVSKLRKFLTEQFNSLDWLKERHVALIGIGGSARNLAQIDQSMKDYPLAGLHQYQMNNKDIAQVLNQLSPLSKAELEKVDGLSTDRADTIVPAITVFLTLYETISATGFILSRKGLRDGVFYEKLTQDLDNRLYPNVLQDSIEELMHQYNLDEKHNQYMQFLTRKVFNGFKEKELGSLSESDWMLLERACCVYNLGEYIDSESSAQHTFYLLANRTIDGLMHIDRLKLALLASFKSKNIFKQFILPYEDWFSKEEKDKLSLLGAILKFSYCLDATKRQVVVDLDVETKGKQMEVTIYCNKDYKPEEYQATKQKKHIEKALNKNLVLQFQAID